MQLLLLTFCLAISKFSNAFILPKIFKSGMVVQAKPTDAVIWGFLNGNMNPVDFYLLCPSKSKKIRKTYIPTKGDDKFHITLPGEEGLKCNLEILQKNSEGNFEGVHLYDIIYGDVWVCSGQSNMQWNIGAIFNASQEVSKMSEYSGIRLYKVKMMKSDQPQDDLMDENLEWKNNWAKSSNTDLVQTFSAVCLLTIRYMADVLGKNKVFGLIETNWGGTIIEAWMPQLPLDQCDIDPWIDPNPNGPNSNSYLYNAMIHPLIGLSIKGALWYQGEQNFAWNRDQYQCTFPAMISEWRRLWSTNTPTSNIFPFGFIQLSTWDPNDKKPGFPVIRWHQTADHGWVPNKVLQNVFMGVAIDTYDEENGIHPRNKQLPSERLAYAGLNVAYNMNEYPTNGPFPEVWNFVLLENEIQVDILYDKTFTWNPIETEGFYVCCLKPIFRCNNRDGAWEKLPEGSVSYLNKSLSMTIPSCSSGLAYLWETTPVLGTAALPMYSDDLFKLPGGPWVKEVKISKLSPHIDQNEINNV